MPKGPWLYPEDQIADAPMRSLAAEITREKLFERLHDELPYQTTVETDTGRTCPTAPRGSSRRSCHPRQPQEDRHRRGRPHAEVDRHGGAQGNRRGQREQGASLPVREGARELARRSRALPGDGAGVSERVSRRPGSPVPVTPRAPAGRLGNVRARRLRRSAAQPPSNRFEQGQGNCRRSREAPSWG